MDRAFVTEIQNHLDEFYPARLHLIHAKQNDEDIGMLMTLATRAKIYDVGNRIIHLHKKQIPYNEDLARFHRLTKLHRYQLNRRIKLNHKIDPSNLKYLIAITALFHRYFTEKYHT
jgi:hypothetical protein